MLAVPVLALLHLWVVIRGEMLSGMFSHLGYHHRLNEAGHVVKTACLWKALEVQVQTTVHSAVDALPVTYHLAIYPTRKIKATAELIPGNGHRHTVRYPHPTPPPLVFGVCIPPEVEDAYAVVLRSLGS